MTYERARLAASTLMVEEYGAWAEREVQALEASGMTREQACQSFNDRCDRKALSEMLNRKIGELTRVLLDPKSTGAAAMTRGLGEPGQLFRRMDVTSPNSGPLVTEVHDAEHRERHRRNQQTGCDDHPEGDIAPFKQLNCKERQATVHPTNYHERQRDIGHPSQERSHTGHQTTPTTTRGQGGYSEVLAAWSGNRRPRASAINAAPVCPHQESDHAETRPNPT